MNAQTTRPCLGLVVAGLLLACDGGKADPTIAKAMETKSEMEVAAAAVADKKHAEAKEAKAAKEALETTRAQQISAAVKLPTELPKDLESACDGFVKAFDEFMLAGGEKDVLAWWDGHNKKLGERRSKCMLQQSVEVAACGTQALSAPLDSLAGVPRRDAARRVLEACLAAYGKDA